MVFRLANLDESRKFTKLLFAKTLSHADPVKHWGAWTLIGCYEPIHLGED